MGTRFVAELFTPEVLAAQERYANRSRPQSVTEPPDTLGPDEAEFLTERDSFYMATSSSNGWPYVQHRGGPPGFVKVLDPHTIGFADFRGNRQLISAGNLSGDERVALIFVDYPRRTRFKLLGRAHAVAAGEDRPLAEKLGSAALGRKVERLVTIDVVGFDWNCPAYITPRYTVEEIETLVEPLHRRIAELEAELARRRG